MQDERDDLALSSSPWMKTLSVFQRTALLEQRALRFKALRKHSRAREMLLTPLGMQQMTSEPLARYKAGRLPEGLRTVADLCCGVGGDSLHLPQQIAVFGVDRDVDALRAYRHNTALFRKAVAIQADVTRLQTKVDGIFIDPARRALVSLAKDRDFDTEPEPGWDALQDIVEHYGNCAVKLGPGAKIPDALSEVGEMEYLGDEDECLELTVRTGSFGRQGWVRAVEMPAAVAIEAQACDLPDSFGRVEDLGEWFYEPVKCVVRAHLFGVLAQQTGLWQLDGRIAYLSGNKRIVSPLLKRYRVLKALTLDERALRNEILSGEIGILEIKKRGLDIDPETWRKKLKPKGSNSATLVFTRLLGKAAVLRVEPDRV